LIIAIASGKGGTGKTTLAVNLSALLAEKRKTYLVDLDVEEPNSGIFLKGKSVHSRNIFRMVPEWHPSNCIKCGKCQDVCRFNAVLKISDRVMLFPELCHSCFACSELCPTNSLPMKGQLSGSLNHISVNENLEMIDSVMEIGMVSSVPLIADTITYVDSISTDTDLILFDSPPGTSCPMIEVCKSADHIIFVTEPTPFGFHDLKLAIKTAEKMNKDFSIVLNRAGSDFDIQILDFCRKEGYRILAKIPYRKKAAELYSEGKLLYQELPEIRKPLDQIIEKLELI